MEKEPPFDITMRDLADQLEKTMVQRMQDASKEPFHESCDAAGISDMLQ